MKPAIVEEVNSETNLALPQADVFHSSQMVGDMQLGSGLSLELMMHRKLIDAMSLPKTSIKTFNAFDNCVGNSSVGDGAKLNHLFEYCSGKAARVIKQCAMMKPSDGYVKARKLLKERFGNDYRISEAWVLKVAEGPSIKPYNGDA